MMKLFGLLLFNQKPGLIFFFSLLMTDNNCGLWGMFSSLRRICQKKFQNNCFSVLWQEWIL